MKRDTRKTRNTAQRRIILEELAKLKTHPTADELYKIVRKKLPKISLGTVYRNLEFLANSGQIHKIESCGAQKRFDGEPGEHYHLRCTKCQKIYDVPLFPLPDLDKNLNKIKGFKITNYLLEFTGLCPKCNQ